MKTMEKKERNRKTGIDIVGHAPWGTHLCLFYKDKQDLIDVLVPYFKAGLQNNEFCMWVTSKPLNAQEANSALRQAVQNLDAYINRGQIEILDYTQWYTQSGKFEADKVLQGWVTKHDQALKRGFDGLRLSGNTFWLEKDVWRKFVNYEATVNNVIGKYRMLAVCTYSLERCGASEVIDVVSTHQFALIRREDEWQIIESSGLKRADDALQASESKYRTLLENLPQKVFLKDRESVYVSCNESYARDLKIKPDEIVGKTDYDFHPREVAEKYRADDKRIMESGDTENIDEKYVQQGHETIVQTVKTPVKDEHGNVSGVLGIFWDITERKNAETALKESEQRLSIVLNSILTAVVIIDVQTHEIVDCNPLATELIGLAREEIIGKLCHKFICPAEKGKCPISDLGQTVDKSERLLIRGDGKEMPILKTVTPTSWQGCEYFVESFVDITERKKAEDKLKESRERLELALSAASMGTWRWNIKTDQDTRDASFNSILGLKAAESTQSVKDFIQYVHPDDRVAVDEEIKRAIRERDIYRIEFRIVRPDGAIYWLSDQGKIYYDQKNKPAYMTGVVFNITERKKADKALEKLNKDLELAAIDLGRSNKELQDFAYVVSHDLKAPLRGIKTLAQWITTDYADRLDENGRGQLNLLSSRVDRMHNLIDGILQYSRVGRVKENKVQVNLNEFVSEVIDMVAPPENISITVENDLPVIECERTRIAQVFQNLLSNAVKFMDKPEGQVRIGCAEEDSFWKFTVTDNGPGIEEKYFEKIFEMFQTLAPRDDVESTGVGLTVAKKIVELYGGKIWVQSKVGQGSTFLFTLAKSEVRVKNAELQASIVS
jgi:PAS domain S-box-containing protein